jgi:signal transduction histidine kinase
MDLIARRRDGTPSHLEASTSLWASGANNFVTVILRDVNERRATSEALRKSETEARDAAAALSELNQTLEQRVQERTARMMQMEEELRQSQKMEAIGQLTGGIAHDFNNLLQGITGGLDLVKKRVMQGRFNEIDRFISGAMTSASRASALTHRLLAFSRRQPLAPKPLEVNPLLASMEELLRRTLGERVVFELVTSGGLWLTKCDPNQLENAVLNLAINARDAMPDGGKLTVETGNSHLDSAYAVGHPEIEPGQYVCISVTDTGSGMSAATIEKAFEPFFTTKPIGRGTGLGLSMIYGFAKQSGGHAKIYSELDKGTTVKLYLPRFRGEVEQEEQIPDLSDIYNAHTNETVLVVEDEFVVRELIVEVLKELGYSTLEADDGPAALKILDSKQRIDLVISDIGLPGLNGRQIIDAAREMRPSLKVLFMTGYAENAAIAAGFLEPGMSMITKPFAMEALATRIREMLEK